MLKHLAIVAALLVAGAVFQGVKAYAAKHGVDRAVEKNLFYKADKLSDRSGKYVMPVLFPFDLVVMLLLSASLGWASATWGPQGLGGSACYYLILPLAYLAFDLAEDSLLVMLLTGSVELGGVTRPLLQTLTAGKFAALVLSAAQTLLAAGAALYRSLSA